MKKTLFLLLSVALLAALVSCQIPNDELPPVLTDETTEQATETEKTPPKDTEAQTEAVTEPQTEPIPDLETEAQTNPETEAQVSPEIETPNQSEDQYCAASIYDNVNEYLQDVWEQQYGQSGAGNVNGNNNSVATMAPVLKKADYRFGGFDKVNPRLSWAYLPSDSTEVNYSEFMYVYIYLSGDTHETLIERHDPPIRDERYGAALIFDTWYFIVDGYYIAVELPRTMTHEEIVSFDTVLEYFDFEIVTYSPTAETGAVQ